MRRLCRSSWRSSRALAPVATTLVLGLTMPVAAAGSAESVDPGPVPRADCGPGSNPETGEQGRVSAADVSSGRATAGFSCNVEVVGHYGSTGGFRVWRYVDNAGHECAYYDQSGTDPKGVFVVDVSDPTFPQRTAILTTPAMLSPHESLSLHSGRGLLAATLGHSLTGPGWIDLYDVRADCRQPALLASVPFAGFGHEGNFSPDGNTFWASSSRGPVTALDITDPSLPRAIWVGAVGAAHGINISEDGTRAYIGDLGNAGGRNPHEQRTTGLSILDVSEVQARVPLPQVREISHLTWPEVSLPHNGIPVSIDGHPYLFEYDELTSGAVGNFGGAYDPNHTVGAARIIDIGDETDPQVISNVRLEVHMPENRAGDQQNDPGAQEGQGGGYALHYCAVPRYEDPGIVACGFVLSGLRVFDIRDPHHPREIAYFNAPRPTGGPVNRAVSGAAFVPERHEIWFNDSSYGFYVLRITNGAWVD